MAPVDVTKPEKIFTGFRVATMCAEGQTCSTDQSGWEGVQLPAAPYGECDVSIGVLNGRVHWLLYPDLVPEYGPDVEVIQGNGRWITPGLIDCHTHLVYGGNRANEWESRLGGKSYEEISRAGGGILSSVNATRAASLEELVESASKRLKSLTAEGVTTVEIKSGYGLDLETELKMLNAANRLGELFPVDVKATFLGAHAVPPEFKGRADDYIDHVCDEMIPAVKDHCSAVDVFCESIAFSVDQMRRVFERAIDERLDVKVHAEQLSNLGGAAEAARMGAISADHLEYLTAKDCGVMASNKTAAVLLPGAFYCLKETQRPPVKALLDAKVPIAIATDSNPGSSPLQSILLAANMSCNLFGLTPEQALTGITRHAAFAIGYRDHLDDGNEGMIRIGAKADFAVWDVDSLAEIIYQIGGHPCAEVYKSGTQVFSQT
jgi:imidazolonepropionase